MQSAVIMTYVSCWIFTQFASKRFKNDIGYQV